MLRSTFDAFDVDRKGYIETEMIGTILDMLGTKLSGEDLEVSTLLYQQYILLFRSSLVTSLLDNSHFRLSLTTQKLTIPVNF